MYWSFVPGGGEGGGGAGAASVAGPPVLRASAPSAGRHPHHHLAPPLHPGHPSLLPCLTYAHVPARAHLSSPIFTSPYSGSHLLFTFPFWRQQQHLHAPSPNYRPVKRRQSLLSSCPLYKAGALSLRQLKPPPPPQVLLPLISLHLFQKAHSSPCYIFRCFHFSADLDVVL